MSEKLIVHYDMPHLDILVALLPTIFRRLGFLGPLLFMGFHLLFKSICAGIRGPLPGAQPDNSWEKARNSGRR